MSGTKRNEVRILVVDDDKDLVRSEKAFFEARGYAVTTAANGTEARAAIARQAPDVVILDVMMDHDAEGFAVAWELKANEATRRIPVVLLTGFLQHLDEKYESFQHVQWQDWPAAQLLEKPVNLAKLGDTVERLLAESEKLAAALAPAAE
jgi:CheY-like chemotaxis protein